MYSLKNWNHRPPSITYSVQGLPQSDMDHDDVALFPILLFSEYLMSVHYTITILLLYCWDYFIQFVYPVHLHKERSGECKMVSPSQRCHWETSSCAALATSELTFGYNQRYLLVLSCFKNWNKVSWALSHCETLCISFVVALTGISDLRNTAVHAAMYKS